MHIAYRLSSGAFVFFFVFVFGFVFVYVFVIIFVFVFTTHRFKVSTHNGFLDLKEKPFLKRALFIGI